jgi:hypothetical protein
MVWMGESIPVLRTASWAVCFLALALGVFPALPPESLGVGTFRLASESGLLALVIVSSIPGLRVKP